MDVRQPDGLEDLRAATAVHNRTWRVGFRGIVPEEVIEAALRSTDEASLEAFEGAVPDHAGRVLVAEQEGTVVGFVRARYGDTSEYVDPLGSEILDLVVDPAQWRGGVGSALLDATVDWLPKMIDGVWMAVLADNERAGSFLETYGFVREATIDAEVGGEPFEHALYWLELQE